MSAEQQPTPKQSDTPRPPQPEVTRDNLTAENLTYFTPHSDEDMQAALALENPPYKVTDKRFNRDYLKWQYYGPNPEPKAPADTPEPESTTAPEPTAEPTPTPEPEPTTPTPETARPAREPELTRKDAAKLSLDELHELIKQYIPEDAEYENGFETLTDEELDSYHVYNAENLKKSLDKYRAAHPVRGPKSDWRQEVYRTSDEARRKAAKESSTPTPESEPTPEHASEETSEQTQGEDTEAALANLRQEALRTLDERLAKKEHVNELVALLWPYTVAYNLEKFLDAGATIDVDKLANEASAAVAHQPLTFLKAGASAETVVSKLSSQKTIDHFVELRDAGIDADLLATRFHLKHLSPEGAQDYIDALTAAGADPSDLTKLQAIADKQKSDDTTPPADPENTPAPTSEKSTTSPAADKYGDTEAFRRDILAQLDTFLGEKDHLDQLVKMLWPTGVADNLEKFIAAGATIDADKLVADSTFSAVSENPFKFLDAGASPDLVVSRMNSSGIFEYYDALIAEDGIDEEMLEKRLAEFGYKPSQRTNHQANHGSKDRSGKMIKPAQPVRRINAARVPKTIVPPKPETTKAPTENLTLSQQFGRLAVERIMNKKK